MYCGCMEHPWLLFWLIPISVVLAVAVGTWQALNPEVGALSKLLTQEKTCEAQAQAAWKVDWCGGEFSAALDNMQDAEGRGR
jgi:hypothetical protein